MTYTFRITFRIPPANRIDHEGSELVLRDGSVGRVAIKPQTFDATVREDVRFALRGEGYETATDARADGERWTVALALGLVSEFVPPDFESRRPRGQSSQWLLDQMNAAAGGAARVFSDLTGLSVVPEDPPPTWGRLDFKGQANRNAAATMAAICRAYEDDLRIDDQTSLAVDLFSAAESVAEDADARFLMLMFAVEAMIDVHRRPERQVAAVNALVETLQDLSNLVDEDRKQLTEALGWLRSESIGAAGRRLASTLDPGRYGDRTAVEFFRHAYKVRSKLVHGNAGEARPSVDEVRSLHGPMLWFTRDLILNRVGLHLPHPLDVDTGNGRLGV